MSSNDLNNPSNGIHPELASNLTPDLVGKMLLNQEKELELKMVELTLQKQQDTNGFEFGKEALRAKAEDRKLQREYELKAAKTRNWFYLGLTTAVTAVVIYALNTNNAAIASEIIKGLILVSSGAVGGYGYAKSGSQKNTDSSSDKK